MEKYARLRERVSAAGLGRLCVPDPARESHLLRAHDIEYISRVVMGTLDAKAIRRIGFPWSAGMVERSRRSVGATIEACRAALRDGFAVSLAGGTHHAFRDHGGGYCVFNDSVVAARVMQAEGRIQRAVIIDCDVHQGDGTAAILADDPTIFTFSMHGATNYPFHKQQSDLDIALPDGTTDDAYLAALAQGLETALTCIEPDLAIYLAGADPFEGDKLGKLALSKAGLATRDRMVYAACAGIPIVTTMAGGYGRDVKDTVDIHFQTVQLAAASASKTP